MVEDDPTLLEQTSNLLETQGAEVIRSVCPGQALSHARRLDIVFDGIVTDYRLPYLNGTELIRLLRRRHNGLGAVLVTAEPEPARAQLTAQDGVRVVPKPYDPSELLQAVLWMVDAQGAPA